MWRAAVLLALAAATPAYADPKPQGPMQTCTAQWLVLRDSGDLHGQVYSSFIRLCLDGKTADWTAPAGRSSKSERTSIRTRSLKTGSKRGNNMKICGAKWQAMKAANATNGQTWRQFSTQCLRNP
jgi:hypothetical protein